MVRSRSKWGRGRTVGGRSVETIDGKPTYRRPWDGHGRMMPTRQCAAWARPLAHGHWCHPAFGC